MIIDRSICDVTVVNWLFTSTEANSQQSTSVPATVSTAPAPASACPNRRV